MFYACTPLLLQLGITGINCIATWIEHLCWRREESLGGQRDLNSGASLSRQVPDWPEQRMSRALQRSNTALSLLRVNKRPPPAPRLSEGGLAKLRPDFSLPPRRRPSDAR